MKTQLSKFAFGIFFLVPTLVFSQGAKIQPCNTYAAMEEYFNANPQAKTAYEAEQKIRQNAYEDFLANRNGNTNAAAKTTALTDYTIPVVFHILHQYGAENISDQVCIDALAQLNRDFAREGTDTNLIFKPFRDGTYAQTPAGYIDSHIKFMLAHKDPQGKCTSGIVHHYDDRTNWYQANNGTNGAPNNFAGITWIPSKYLNIIVVKNIIPQGTSAGIIVGYTYKPGAWPTNAVQDAIVYRYDYLGGSNARLMTHEFGHWLDLDHTFGNTNNPGTTCGSDDGIPDTPITRGNFGISSACSVHTLSPVCFSSNTPFNQAPYFQNSENFMDYSDCPKNFTTGQTNKMQLTLASPVSARNNLSTPSNLIATDVEGSVPCSLIADWASTNGSYTVCAGGSLPVKDFSYNGFPAYWTWSANNGATAAAPGSSVTSITFPTPGITTVTLTVVNTQGMLSSLTRTVLVKDASPGTAVPLMESFENGLPANWSVENPDAGSAEWQHTSNVTAHHGISCYYIEGAHAAANQQDYLYLPIINMQNNPDKTFTFAYSYARASANHNDQLRVQASLDCGGTWLDLANLSAAQMANNTAGIIDPSTAYFPNSWVEWYEYSVQGVAWNQCKNSPNLLLRFNFIESSTGFGNNIFIDAINIGGTVGLSELAKNILLNMYPNPTNGETVLEFNLDDASSIKVNVLDVTGRTVTNVTDNNFAPGEHRISINENNSLEKGIYFVNMTVNGKSLTQKLLVD